MLEEKELEQKLEKFLKDNNRQYYENSVKYLSLRNTKMMDGSFRKLHLVSYMVSISDQTYDGDSFFMLHLMKKNII